MKSSRCGLENPPEALRCDCGYDFPSGTVMASYAAAAEKEKQTYSGSAKKPWAAFGLNFLLAGAGLAYLGMWRAAVMDLAASVLVAILIAVYAPQQLGVAGWLVPIANGVFAVVIARSRFAD